MTRNSKTLFTSGLLALAVLGPIPRSAEAKTPDTNLEVNPVAGASVAEKSHQVAVPEPTAQTSPPQVAPDAAPQPAWSPALDQTAPPPEPVALAPKPDPAPAAKAAPLATALSLAPTVKSSEATPQPAIPVTTSTANAAAAAATPAAEPVVKAPSRQTAKQPEAASNPTADSAANSSAPAIARLTPSEPGSSPPAVPMPAKPTAADAMPQVRITTPATPIPLAEKPQLPVVVEPAPAQSPQDVSVEAIAARIQRSNVMAGAPIPQEPTPQVTHQKPQLPVLPTPGTDPTQADPDQATEPQLAAVAPPALVTQTSETQADRATPGEARVQRSHPSISTVDLIAQDPQDEAEQIRQDLRVEPLPEPFGILRSYAPSPNAGIPSAFGAEWGDVFISASLAGADRIRPEADGSLSLGLGLGNSRSLVGVELSYNILSIRRFAENGSFDVKVHREISRSDRTQVAVALGWNNIANYGSNVAGTESSPYGVISAAHLLQPENLANRMPITGTLGVGGGGFSGTDSDVGVLAGVGLQVHPQLSLNTAWSGVGLNVSASMVPAPSVPLTLNLTYGDITNNTEAGSVAVVTLGYGFNFGPRF